MLVGKMSYVWFGPSTTSIIFASSGYSDETQMGAYVIRTKPCVFYIIFHTCIAGCIRQHISIGVSSIDYTN